MRRKRTIYFNDARHYYLFVFEPPMALEDAWVAVDEAAQAQNPVHIHDPDSAAAGEFRAVAKELLTRAGVKT